MWGSIPRGLDQSMNLIELVSTINKNNRGQRKPAHFTFREAWVLAPLPQLKTSNTYLVCSINDSLEDKIHF